MHFFQRHKACVEEDLAVKLQGHMRSTSFAVILNRDVRTDTASLWQRRSKHNQFSCVWKLG